MKWFTKKIEVPTSNSTELVDAVQLWEVRWRSRHGDYYADTQQEMEAFPSEVEAQRFAIALKNAFKLLRHTSGCHVSVKKAESAKSQLSAIKSA